MRVSAGRTGERVAALAIVVLVPALLRFLSFQQALEVCDRVRPLGGGGASPAALADRVRRWLAWGRGPWAATCLTQSMVLYAMLRQHGHRPRLHVGVRGEAQAFVAHAWVSLAGRAVADDDLLVHEYRELLVHDG